MISDGSSQAEAVENPDEAAAFVRLQRRLAPMFRRVFPDPLAPRTVVVIPSLSLDPAILSKISGIQHYEERMLCMLMLLRLPRTRVIYITSVPIDTTIISYYLRLLAGVPGTHARKRLTMLSCHDASPASVTSKILARPRLLARIREAIREPEIAHMTCFNVTELERRLAVRLGVPIYGCDPDLADLGYKSGSREVLREAGALVPDGFERLRDLTDVVEALAGLRTGNPELTRAAVKLDQGTSGEGNAVFTYADCPAGAAATDWVRDHLPANLQFEAREETWDGFLAKLQQMGGVVEAWIDGPDKRSPSVQCRIDPLGGIEIVSTHDQVLGGPSGQIFLGSTFPADEQYRLEIQRIGLRTAEALRGREALGRFGVDFVSVRDDDGWKHYGIEINLRKGGTTHPFMTLQYLTDGYYDTKTGLYLTPTGQPRFYYATDNLNNPNYRRLVPEDLIDIAVEHDLHFHAAKQRGVAFHLIGAMSEFGKLGVLCVAEKPDAAQTLYHETVKILDRESAAQP